jgi:hypothetical protein
MSLKNKGIKEANSKKKTDSSICGNMCRKLKKKRGRK